MQIVEMAFADQFFRRQSVDLLHTGADIGVAPLHVGLEQDRAALPGDRFEALLRHRERLLVAAAAADIDEDRSNLIHPQSKDIDQEPALGIIQRLLETHRASLAQHPIEADPQGLTRRRRQQGVQTLADHLGQRQSELLQKGRIGAQHPVIGGELSRIVTAPEHRKAAQRMVDQPAEPLFALGQCQALPLFLGDIAQHQHRAVHLTLLIAQGCTAIGNQPPIAARHPHRQHRAGGRRRVHLAQHRVQGGNRRAFDRRDGRLAMRRGGTMQVRILHTQYPRHGLAERIGFGPAGQRQRHRIHPADQSCRIDHDHRIADRTQDRLQLFLALVQPLLLGTDAVVGPFQQQIQIGQHRGQQQQGDDAHRQQFRAQQRHPQVQRTDQHQMADQLLPVIVEFAGIQQKLASECGEALRQFGIRLRHAQHGLRQGRIDPAGGVPQTQRRRLGGEQQHLLAQMRRHPIEQRRQVTGDAQRTEWMRAVPHRLLDQDQQAAVVEPVMTIARRQWTGAGTLRRAAAQAGRLQLQFGDCSGQRHPDARESCGYCLCIALAKCADQRGVRRQQPRHQVQPCRLVMDMRLQRTDEVRAAAAQVAVVALPLPARQQQHRSTDLQHQQRTDRQQQTPPHRSRQWRHAAHPQAEQGRDDPQQTDQQRRNQDGFQSALAPICGIHVNAEQGDHGPLRAAHRREGADPLTPAIPYRTLDQRTAAGDGRLQHRADLGVGLAGRRGIRTVGRFAVHGEVHLPIRPHPQQINEAQTRICRAHLTELGVQTLVIGPVPIDRAAAQGGHARRIDRPGDHRGTRLQFGAQARIGRDPEHRQQTHRCRGQQQEQQPRARLADHPPHAHPRTEIPRPAASPGGRTSAVGRAAA